MITTTHGDMDESTLIKTEVVVDNENEHTTIVEYCLAGCDGPWHRTHQGDGEGVCCAKHVHRSVDMFLKRGLEISGIAGGLG